MKKQAKRRITRHESDDLIFRFLAAEREFGNLVHGTEPESMRRDWRRVPELRREFERRA